MPCYNPLHAFRVGTNLETGKPRYKITKTHQSLANKGTEEGDYILVPCGKCIGCRLEYARQWANRCVLEMQYHDENCFLTLTYDDDHLPWSDPYDGDKRSQTLRPRDLQLFIKNLRADHPDKRIRFFACGEYGDKSLRPHYHAIIFGYKPTDLKFYKKSDLGDNYWISEEMNKLWSDIIKTRNDEGKYTYSYDQRGYVVVGDANWQTCSYTARYITKKLNGPAAETYKTLNMVPPFVRMSRRPGIGLEYFADHPEIYDTSKFFIPGDTEKIQIRPPRYFESYLPDDILEEMKSKRMEEADESLKNRLRMTDADMYYLNNASEESMIERTKVLKRGAV